MPLLVLALPFVLVLVVLALMPLILFQRYRTGTARRQARGWVATANVFAMALSAAFFTAVAALTNVFVADALRYTLLGLGSGCVLGLLGLWLSRWESGSGALHYTPNRWLVLAITLVVTVRVAYGFWRAWHTWQTNPHDTSWLASAGLAGSLGAGAVVLGYYLTYWIGVRRWIRGHRRQVA